MNSLGIDPRIIDSLGRATSLELYHLNTVIEQMLADPRRIVKVRTHLHLGQTVRFLDSRSGQMRNGRVVAMGDTKITLHEAEASTEWKLPYTAVDPPQATNSTSTPSPPPNLPPAKPAREDFRRGDKVSFEDKYLQTQVGTVFRINQHTATVHTEDAQSWRVGFTLLRHVLDI